MQTDILLPYTCIVIIIIYYGRPYYNVIKLYRHIHGKKQQILKKHDLPETVH